MANQNWSRIADLYSKIVELGQEEQASLIDASGLTPEERVALEGLLSNASGQTGFFSTGGASGDTISVLEPGDLVGNWRVVELVGAGGMGEVYRVERADGHYEQIAALKRITVSDESAFERFERERQILAQLEHPNIARLIDGGVDGGGSPFLVMEFIEGELLVDHFRQNRLGLEDRLKSFLHVCAALEHAHSRFVLHRDIKPSNMMVTSSGEIKLIDFGVAGLVDEGESEAKAPFTKGYAAAEQLSGGTVSVQTDLFGLGVSLAEVLTGVPPLQDSAELPQLASLPADIRAIIRKATSLDPKERYQSVEGFVADIRNYMRHDPVSARKGSLFYQSRLFLRRNYLAVGLFGVLIAGMAGTFWQYRKAEVERDAALQQRERLSTMQAATFLMFSQAGSNADEKSARGLINQAAEQAKKDFEENPNEAAVVLHMFGELLFLINDYVAAEPILKSVADLPLEDGNEDLVARASHDLANVYLRSGKTAEAREALDKALAIWGEAPALYQDQIVTAALVQSQLRSADGDLAAASKVLEDSLPKRLSLSGEASMETAVLLTNIGVARMKQGDIPGAIDASEKARNAFETIQRLKTPDGLNTMNNLATLYHITGQIDRAETAYASALEIREGLYGPSAALAVLMSNYGKLKLQQSEPEKAKDLLLSAVDMADVYSGPASPPALAARFGLIETFTILDEAQKAEEVLDYADAQMTDANMTTGPYAGMLHLARAQVRAKQNRTSEARASLQLADDIFSAMGPAAARYSAKVEQLRQTLQGNQ